MADKEQLSSAVHKEQLSSVVHKDPLHSHEKDWKKVDENVRKYCENYAIIKTKNDFTKAIILISVILVFIVVTTIAGKHFGMFQCCALAISMVIGFMVYRMGVDFQRSMMRVLKSEDCEYALVLLKDVQILETEAAGNFFAKKPGIRNIVTVSFSDGDETFDSMLDKMSIGSQLLLLKKKNVNKLGSKYCFKIPYHKES